MALGATIYVFSMQLSHVDRNVYETLELRLARHPSESAEFLVTRLLAYCLEYTEGITFSKGLSEPDEPAISVRDLTGEIQAWIEVGLPDAARVHKSAKAAPSVTIYAHRDVEQLLSRLSGERIHRAENLRIRFVERTFLAAIIERLDRRMDFDLAISDQVLYLSLGEDTL